MRNVRIMMFLFLLMLIVSVLPVVAQGDETLRIIAWNLESGGISASVIASELGAFDDVHIWGLSEVDSRDAQTFETGIEIGENANYEAILGSTGGADRLLIVYDTTRLNLVSSTELSDISLGGRVRAPLVAEFVDLVTGEQFLFVENHLARGDNTGRHTQAVQLNDWAEAQTLSVILTGDLNFAVEVDLSSHDLGFDNLIADGVFVWLQPTQLIRTQCSAGSNDKANGVPEDRSCTYNSILDLFFTAGDAQNWAGTSTIVVRNGDFPDDNTTSDHRPVMAEFTFGDGGELPDTDTDTGTVVTRTALLEQTDALQAQIDALQAQLDALRELIEQLP